MEGILDARLSWSNRQIQESVAFTNFPQSCLPSLSEEIFSQYITNVTAYTRQSMQLSRDGGSHQAQGTGFDSHQHRMLMHARQGRSEGAHASAGLP